MEVEGCVGVVVGGDKVIDGGCGVCGVFFFVFLQVDAALDDVVKMDNGGGRGGRGGRGGHGGPMRGRGGPMRGARGGFRGGTGGGMRTVPYGGGGRGGQVCDNCFQPGD